MWHKLSWPPWGLTCLALPWRRMCRTRHRGHERGTFTHTYIHTCEYMLHMCPSADATIRALRWAYLFLRCLLHATSCQYFSLFNVFLSFLWNLWRSPGFFALTYLGNCQSKSKNCEIPFFKKYHMQQCSNISMQVRVYLYRRILRYVCRSL